MACHRDRDLHICEYNPAYCADGGEDGPSDDALESDAVTDGTADEVLADGGADSATESDGDGAPDTESASDAADSGMTPSDSEADTSVPDADATTADVSVEAATPDAMPDAPAETAPDTAICSSGAYRCSGDILQRCSPDRSAWDTVVACPSSTCNATAMRCTACVPGTYSCSGADRRECSALGTWVTKATCATPELCSASTGTTCATPTCAVGETTCSGKIARTCKTSRDGWNDTNCAIGCSAGACLKVTALPPQLGAHVCAVLSDGTVRCWGYGFTATPTPIAGISSAVEIATSYSSSAVRLADGSLRWWGTLYTPDPPGYVNSPVPLAIPGIPSGAQVSVGTQRICAVQSDTTVKCYGKGCLGDGTCSDFTTAKSIPGITGAHSVSIFDVPAAGFIIVDAGAKGWGANAYGALGIGTTEQQLSPVSSFGFATRITFSNTYACALLATGGVRCAGGNDLGQLGRGTITSAEPIPADVSGLSSGVRSVSTGAMHACAALMDGTVRCWGDNSDGALGNGTTTSSSLPVVVTGLTGVSSVACGSRFSCALLNSGDVKCWGSTAGGQLGNGVTTSGAVTSPTSVIW